MRSYRDFFLSALAALLAIGSSFAPGSPFATGFANAQDAPPLDRLLASFAAVPGLTAHFREEKRIALLALPVRSEGVIHYTPGKLLRRVTSPSASVALIDARRLVMRAGSDRQVIDLSDNPVVAGFVGSIRHVLAGDRAALETAYRVTYEREGARWTLGLRPRDATLARFLRKMELHGEGVRLQSMRMIEVSGDETTTEFFDVDATRRFSAREIARIFRVD